MHNRELEKQVQKLFEEIKVKSHDIVLESRENIETTERIMRLVSSTVSSEIEGYIVAIYIRLVKKIKDEEFFKNPENLNAFYKLNLRGELNGKYKFNIEDIDSYKVGIEYKDINCLYTTAATMAGTTTFGGILKFALSNFIDIPFVVVIAGAIAGACAAYFAVSTKNRKAYIKAMDKFLDNLENDILDWLVEVETYFNEKVRTLYKKEVSIE